jgi:hypothetical protein
MPEMLAQSGVEPIPDVVDQNANNEAALLAEEVKVLRKLAAAQKRWWQDYSLLIAGMAFLLSLATSIISAWTSYRKDIHDQQAQLTNLTQSVQDLSIHEVELLDKYKNDSELRGAIYGLMSRQIASELKRASTLALELGANATTGELVTIAIGAGDAGNVSQTIQLLNLAVSAASTADEKATALRSLGYAQIRFGGSGEMQALGAKNFKRAINLDLDPNYSDLSKLSGLNVSLKIAAEYLWSAAYIPSDCSQSRIHHTKAQEYVSHLSSSDLDYARKTLGNMGINIQGTTITPFPGCPSTPEAQAIPTDSPAAKPTNTQRPLSPDVR